MSSPRGSARRLRGLAVGSLLFAALVFFFGRGAGPLPFDLALTRVVGALSPSNGWAVLITDSARFPGSLALLFGSGVVALVFHRVRGLSCAVVSYLCAHGLDQLLKPLLARPRPSPSLIEFASGGGGYSLPSTFALVYGATLGFVAVLFLGSAKPKVRLGGVAALVVLLLAGSARVALGAHWPSDILASFALMLALNVGLLALARA